MLGKLKNEMGKYRVLKIMNTVMEVTNQKVALIELARVDFIKFPSSFNLQPYTFSNEGENFILDYGSQLTKSIIEAANKEEIVKLNISDFTFRKEKKNGKTQNLYYHKNVILLDEESIKSGIFSFKAQKNLGKVYLEIAGKFSAMQADIALKDICIFLKSQYAKK